MPQETYIDSHSMYFNFVNIKLKNTKHKICVGIFSKVGYKIEGDSCGSLNVIGPHKIIGGGTIMRCGLVGEVWQTSSLPVAYGPRYRTLNYLSSTVSTCKLLYSTMMIMD